MIGALRIAASLERMGDLAEHVAKQARLRYPRLSIPQELRGTFAEMGGLAEAIVELRGSIRKGRSFHDALKDAGVFPPFYLSMVEVGEATGTLDSVLDRLATAREKVKFSGSGPAPKAAKKQAAKKANRRGGVPGPHHRWLGGDVDVLASARSSEIVDLDPPLDENDLAQIGYTIARPFWRRGLATEAVRALVDFAFERFPVHRITASVDPRNAASCRVLEKAGFTREAHFRQSE